MKKIIALLIILSLFATSAIYAGNDKGNGNPPVTTTITGKVLDQNTSEELAGVLVQIEGTDLKTYTDIEGNFKIDGLKPGNYDLNVSYISYKETELSDFNTEHKSKNLEIKLEQIK